MIFSSLAVWKSGEALVHYHNSVNDASLVPRPPPFLLSVCIHSNTQEWKSSKNGECLGVSGCEVVVREG